LRVQRRKERATFGANPVYRSREAGLPRGSRTRSPDAND
jgi:hypothetical protein